MFLWDTEWLKASRIALKRIVFLTECLQELPGAIEIRMGDLATEWRTMAKACGADYVLAQRTPDPRLRAAAAATERQFPVVWYDPRALVEETRAFDLKHFSR